MKVGALGVVARLYVAFWLLGWCWSEAITAAGAADLKGCPE